MEVAAVVVVASVAAAREGQLKINDGRRGSPPGSKRKSHTRQGWSKMQLGSLTAIAHSCKSKVLNSRRKLQLRQNIRANCHSEGTTRPSKIKDNASSRSSSSSSSSRKRRGATMEKSLKADHLTATVNRTREKAGARCRWVASQLLPIL